jgi:myo-inositol-1(or 4)-monophosphatase
MDLAQLVRDLALELRAAALPLLGSHAARAHGDGGPGESGDVTFAIDEHAESRLESFLAERAPDIAYYSEDRGLVVPDGGDVRHVLVVDPIDGTRPAAAGFESCCVAIAAAPFADGVAMGDVRVGCVVEIPSGTVFLAERGRGLLEGPRPALSRNERLDRMFWTFGFRGRPARLLTEVLADLIDASSVGGGTFDLGSAAYDTTRVITGQLDAYVEPGPLLVEEIPALRADFERVGGGSVLNNAPYDLAAAVLCATEAGAIVTDARGRPLDDRPLLGSGPDFQMSIVASANPRLHDLILEQVAAGLDRLAAQSGDTVFPRGGRPPLV